MKHQELIVVLDFGSQYTQLIARRVRESNVYCEIHPYNTDLGKIKELKPKGIILSGGPASVYAPDAPKIDPGIFTWRIPILGICYGMQIMVDSLRGKVEPSQKREYGRAMLDINQGNPLFRDISGQITVWMSHGDQVTRLPDGFEVVASTDNAPQAVINKDNLYGIQFHPEVIHTPEGDKILRNFCVEVCGMSADWTMKAFVESAIEDIRGRVGDGKVICGLSGGVDSAVTAVLIHKAIGDQLTCIFVNNGVLRANEADKVIEIFRNNFHINLVYADAEDRFLDLLEGEEDPEKKRKIIGCEFIRVFEEEAAKIGQIDFLAQGTLYPDVIESVSVKGPSAVIKSHHNVGGLPEDLKFELVEPLRELFKDEVRQVGREMGIPQDILGRHPFPGPGLAIRIIGDITRERLRVLREADVIVLEELKKNDQYDKVWQAFAVLLPIKTVGVMGDERTYENVIAVRCVGSQDGMTADWSRLPYDVLAIISNRIINEVKGVNRVTYDISSKPPATIEWE